jgi:multidrug efflux pump subunit AcrA (membrane-fusion protein)
VEVGLVKKDQVIATPESSPERAARDLAQSRATMQCELKAAQARVELTQKTLVRAEELYKQNFISVNARDEAEADYRLATEPLHHARENQKLAELGVNRVGAVLAMPTMQSSISTTLKSPNRAAFDSLSSPASVGNRRQCHDLPRFMTFLVHCLGWS